MCPFPANFCEKNKYPVHPNLVQGTSQDTVHAAVRADNKKTEQWHTETSFWEQARVLSEWRQLSFRVTYFSRFLYVRVLPPPPSTSTQIFFCNSPISTCSHSPFPHPRIHSYSRGLLSQFSLPYIDHVMSSCLSTSPTIHLSEQNIFCLLVASTSPLLLLIQLCSSLHRFYLSYQDTHAWYKDVSSSSLNVFFFFISTLTFSQQPAIFVKSFSCILV